MKLSIIIPAYNEENTIEKLIQRVSEVELPNIEKEIVVVNDCSKDGTLKIVNKIQKHFGLKIISHDKNQGKGAAVKNGLIASTGDIVVIQDADLEYDPREYGVLIAPILNGNADVVFGSRFMGGAPHRVLYFWHSVGNKFLTLFSNMLTNLNLTDMETCYKMFTREVVDDIKNKLESKRFGIEPEITARVKKYRVYEVGISYTGRTYKEGKKIGWKDGFSALKTIITYNLFK